jgi:tol-pal system protein YbgF
MSLSRIVLVFVAAAPLSFGASKEIQELQRDVAMLQDQLRSMQKDFGDRLVTTQTLVQTTLDAVNRTNNLVNVMENKFNDAMKQQQQSVAAPVMSVGTKLDQMSEDFRAVRESVLDMNTRMGKLDAKMADLQNLINTLRTAPPPPPGSPASGDGVNPAAQVPAGPPAGVSAETLYTNGYRDYVGGKYDIGMQEFTDYLRYFPTTAFASNAQYYIGDIYYRRQDYANAQQAFDAVLERYADGNKTPDALYMKGQSLIGLGKNDAAAAEFRDVIRRFPDSDIAAKAKARLKEMGLSVGATSSKRRAH